MAYQIPIIKSAVGNTIIIEHPSIPDEPMTNLASPASASAASLTVLDNGGFVNGDYIVIGEIGNDKTEIAQINGAVTAGTSLTITPLVYDHAVDAPIQKTIWTQIRIKGASTVAGTQTAIATFNIQPDRPYTAYVNTGTTYAYYFAEYYNGSTYSAQSDPAPAADYAYNTVRKVKDSALSMTGVNIEDSQLINDSFLNTEIINCEREVWTQRRQWSWSSTFNYILGTVTAGQYSIALPSNIRDNNSNSSILSVRLKDKLCLTYLTKEEFDMRYVDNRHTALTSGVLIGATTINVTSTADFDDNGSITIGSDEVSYTGKTSTSFTGCTNVLANHNSGQDVWQNVVFQEPRGYTVWNGYIYFDHPVVSDFEGCNVYLDYYRVPTTVDTDNDTVNIPDVSIYHYYLAWKILLRKNNGKATEESESMRNLYETRKKILMLRERNGQRPSLRPRLNKIRYPDQDEYVQTVPAAIP